jgi:hypothetical protein
LLFIDHGSYSIDEPAAIPDISCVNIVRRSSGSDRPIVETDASASCIAESSAGIVRQSTGLEL